MGIDTLLLRTRSGFERVMHRHRNRVYGFACHMLGDRDEAADVTQEVFIRLWKARDAMDGKRVGAWLMHVTRNACIDVLRHRRTVRAVMSDDEAALDAAASVDDRPDLVLESRDFRQRLETEVQALAEPYRSLIILRELQDMSYGEISAALDLPMSSVKVYLHRARRTLRARLESAVMEAELEHAT